VPERDLTVVPSADPLRVTPRTAAVLRAALRTLAEGIRADVEALGHRPVVLGEHRRLAALDRLPRASWPQDATWRLRVAGAAEDLAADLRAGRSPRPRCTAEEVCLHLALEDAEDAVNDEIVDESVLRLPEDERDYDWDEVDALLVSDVDLFGPKDPGPDDVDDDLHPLTWFRPFDAVGPRPA
jgi:hypothetical protein